MPYSNLPKEKWPAMDRCVVDVMARQKLPKARAIAICHSSIAGGKKIEDIVKDPEQSRRERSRNIETMETSSGTITFNVNMNEWNDYWTWKTSVDDSTTFTALDSETLKEEEVLKEGGEENMTKKTVKKQDDPVEEPVKEEEAADAEETPTETPVEGTEETPTKGGEEAAPADVEEADKVSTLLKSVIAKVDEIHAAIAKQDDGNDSAPAEGAASDSVPEDGDGASEAAPEVPTSNVAEATEDAAVEEGAQDAPSEGTEEVAKSLGKVADSMEKLAKSVDDVSKQVSEMDARLTKIEEQPAPSKIVSPVVVSKSGGSESPDNSRLAEIKKELEELEEMKKTRLEDFQVGRKWEKALDLIAERDQIMALA